MDGLLSLPLFHWFMHNCYTAFCGLCGVTLKNPCLYALSMRDRDRASFVVGYMTLFFCLNKPHLYWLASLIKWQDLGTSLAWTCFNSLFVYYLFLNVSVLAVKFWLDEHRTLHLAFQFCSCRHDFWTLYTNQRKSIGVICEHPVV